MSYKYFDNIKPYGRPYQVPMGVKLVGVRPVCRYLKLEESLSPQGHTRVLRTENRMHESAYPPMLRGVVQCFQYVGITSVVTRVDKVWPYGQQRWHKSLGCLLSAGHLARKLDGSSNSTSPAKNRPAFCNQANCPAIRLCLLPSPLYPIRQVTAYRMTVVREVQIEQHAPGTTMWCKKARLTIAREMSVR